MNISFKTIQKLAAVTIMLLVVVIGAPNSLLADTVQNTGIDLCPNIEGIQTEVPGGYHLVESISECVRINENGMPTVQSVKAPYDWCSNYKGIQTSLPSGFVRRNEGTICTPKDPSVYTNNVCPAGSFPRDNGECSLDVCANLRGAQATIPTGYIMNSPGICTLKAKK
jgi:hypothetical protein